MFMPTPIDVANSSVSRKSVLSFEHIKHARDMYTEAADKIIQWSLTNEQQHRLQEK